MTETVRVAVPRKGRPLEAVLDRLAAHGDHRSSVDVQSLADGIVSTLQYEKAVTKGTQPADDDVYERLAAHSDLSDPTAPEYSLFRDDRAGMPRRIVFDSVTIPFEDVTLQLVGREEPFRSLRTHSFPLGFDSADLVLEEVVQLRPEPLERIADLNARIDPRDTDVRVVSGLGDTVYHTLMGDPALRRQAGAERFDRAFVADYGGSLCISPRYERLVEAVLGTDAVADVDFCYPAEGQEEEAAIAETGLGVYLTMTGSTARAHGLELGERLFPSETVLLESCPEVGTAAEGAKELFVGPSLETELAV